MEDATTQSPASSDGDSAPAMPMLMTPPNTIAECMHQPLLQQRAVAAADHDGHIRPGDQHRLTLQPDDGNNAHSPCATVRELPLLRLR